MLVLSRNENEFIRIVVPPSEHPQTVIVGIESVRGNRVRIGIVARRQINVSRSDAERLKDVRDPKDLIEPVAA